MFLGKAPWKNRTATATTELIKFNNLSDDSETRLALLEADVFVCCSAAGDKVWPRAATILEHVWWTCHTNFAYTVVRCSYSEHLQRARQAVTTL
jgi:hypothetical protein